MAAKQGYADAQNDLGSMYDSGVGVNQDSAEAVRWYRIATAPEAVEPALAELFEQILADWKPAHIAWTP